MTSDEDVSTFQRRLTVSWVVMAVLAGLLLLPHARRWLEGGTFGGATGQPRAMTPRGELADFEKASINIFDSVSPSVVYINTSVEGRNRWTLQTYEVETGTGSGFVWDTEGHIVTNYHVVKNATSLQVVFSDQSSYEAVKVQESPDHDLAVLKVDAPEDLLKPVLIGESSNLRVGQSVFAIGNPFRLGQTFTTGVVSARSRSIKGQGSSGRVIEDVIQIDAAINPGNSGGPLLDSAGRLIGVNTAIYSPSGASAGIGFAIPVDTVNRVVPILIANRRYVPPRLGIAVNDVLNETVAVRFNIHGIVVHQVYPDGPADRSGLRGMTTARGTPVVGDVILKVGDDRVTTSNELLLALQHHKPGDTVTLTILRDGEELTVDTTLE